MSTIVVTGQVRDVKRILRTLGLKLKNIPRGMSEWVHPLTGQEIEVFLTVTEWSIRRPIVLAPHSLLVVLEGM